MGKVLLASLALAMSAGAVSAASIDFNVSRNWTSGWRTYTNGTESVSVNGATHDEGGAISTSAYTASWSGSAGGLGVCSGSLSGYGTNSNRSRDCSESHTIDSRSGRDEFVLFDFGALLVELTSVTFAYVDDTDDYNVYTYANGFGAAPTRSSGDNSLPNNCWVCTVSNFVADPGSLFAIGVRGSGDKVKLQAISFRVVNPVPVPAAGWMLVAGLGGLAVAARRRRTG